MPQSEYGWINTVASALMIMDRDHSVVAVNECAARLLESENGTLIGRKVESLVAEADRALFVRAVDSARAAPPSSPADRRQVLRALGGGREITVEIALKAAEDGSHTVVVIQDISEREDLRESQERLRLLAAASDEVLQYVNVRDDLLVLYSGEKTLIGYAPGEFPATLSGWQELIHPDDVERIGSEMENIVASGAPAWDFRYRARAKDGSYRHWRDRGTFHGFIDGGGNEGYGAVSDETEYVQKLEEIGRLKDRLQAESNYLQTEIRGTHNFEDIIGKSRVMMAMLGQVEQVAGTDATVMLLGETGTGKELVARAIHERSKRSDRPLIKVDCTTFPPGLVESELFGHEKGAFTGAHAARPGRFELADGGTIFLDEIGDLPLDLQGKLLRVLQDGEIERIGSSHVRRVDVRVVSATNRNLRHEMEEGRFRSDLYFRLNVFPIEIAPLRDRREDVPLLASYFLSRCAPALGSSVQRIPNETLRHLVEYDWPGNVRELRNVIERALILSPGRDLVLGDELRPLRAESPRDEPSLRSSLKSLERQKIVEALMAAGWKIKGNGNAAHRLGLKPSTLRSRMESLEIRKPSQV